MALDELRAGLALVDEHSDEAEFAGVRPDVLVEQAEQRLGVTFPPSYRAFVSELGAGDIAGEEFYGVLSEDFENSGVPDGIWMTLRERDDSGLPNALVVVHSPGDGTLHAIDTSLAGDADEAPVVAWVPGTSTPDDELEAVAPDFGTFFRQTVERAL